MSMSCWLFGHDYVDSEIWEGKISDVFKIRIVYSKCTKCGDVFRKAYVAGNLYNKMLEGVPVLTSKEEQKVLLITEDIKGKSSPVSEPIIELNDIVKPNVKKSKKS